MRHLRATNIPIPEIFALVDPVHSGTCWIIFWNLDCNVQGNIGVELISSGHHQDGFCNLHAGSRTVFSKSLRVAVSSRSVGKLVVEGQKASASYWGFSSPSHCHTERFTALKNMPCAALIQISPLPGPWQLLPYFLVNHDPKHSRSAAHTYCF